MQNSVPRVIKGCILGIVTALSCADAAPQPPLKTASPSPATSPAASPANTALSFRDAGPRIESALNAGDIRQADSLFALTTTPGQSGTSHHHAIADARLAASKGDWKKTEAILRAWRENPARLDASGEIFFWLAWAALHQARLPEADSLLVLASAYSDESRAQNALEYRFAALLENSSALQPYLRGLPESPLPRPLRIASLRQVPQSSRLHPHSQWQLALWLEAEGDSTEAREILTALSRNTESPPGRRAALYLALKRENPAPDSARAAYESFLIRHQQGVSAEFARKRAEKLRQSP